jgi:hypothetical protein
MNTQISFVPRIDGGGSASYVDVSKFGAAEVRQDGLLAFANLGADLTKSSKYTQTVLTRAYQRVWPGASEKKCQDAAKDFITSGLNLEGGKAEEVIRPNGELIFVPGPGRTVVLPSRNVLKPGLRSNTYRIREQYGEAQWVSPEAIGRGLGQAGTQVEEKIKGAEYYAVAYSHNVVSDWENGYTGEDTLADNRDAATVSLDDFRERVSLVGDASKNISGFATLGDAVILNCGQAYSSMVPTANQMLQRLAAMQQRFKLANKQLQPNSVLAPDADRLAMQTTFFGAGSEGPSVWDRAIKMFPWLENGTWDDRMLTANSFGNGPRWILFSQDPKNLYIEHTETMIFGPFIEFLTMTYIMLRRIGGVVSKIPERVFYCDFAPLT